MRMRTDAIIFDMDGTMIDSMPWHAQAWVEFARRRGMNIDVPDLMARTTGRNGTECIVELLGRPVSQDEADALTHEKETIYRELFAPRFAEVADAYSGLSNPERRALYDAQLLQGTEETAPIRLPRSIVDPAQALLVNMLHATTGALSVKLDVVAARSGLLGQLAANALRGAADTLRGRAEERAVQLAERLRGRSH